MADQNYVGVDEEQQPLQVKTKEETDKKCPACGGVMDFDPATGGLLCPYCGHTQEIETEEGLGEQDFASAEITGNCNWGAEKKVVICQSCGAESVYDALDVSNECPYCGSNQVMEEKGKDTLAPGGVCPFKIDKKKAGANFKSWIKGKLFCPSLAKEKAKPDSFKGVYLPYWTFDTQTQSTYEVSTASTGPRRPPTARPESSPTGTIRRATTGSSSTTSWSSAPLAPTRPCSAASSPSTQPTTWPISPST